MCQDVRVNNKTGSERAIDFWKDFSSRLRSAEDGALNYEKSISPLSDSPNILPRNLTMYKLSKCMSNLINTIN